jgi:hypothetical protein
LRYEAHCSQARFDTPPLVLRGTAGIHVLKLVCRGVPYVTGVGQKRQQKDAAHLVDVDAEAACYHLSDDGSKSFQQQRVRCGKICVLIDVIVFGFAKRWTFGRIELFFEDEDATLEVIFFTI